MEKLHNAIKIIFIIPIYLFIFGFLFFVFGLSRVDALVLYTGDNNTQDYVSYGFNGTTRGYIYNCSSTNSCSTLSSGSTMGNGMVYTDSSLTNDTNGLRFDFLVNQSLYKNTLYSIRSFYCTENPFTPKAYSWSGVNQGSSMNKNNTYYTLYKSETSMSSVIGSLDTGGYFVDSCYSVYQVFEPSVTSAYYGLQIATESGSISGRYVFLGYDLEVIGATDGLTQSQVQDVVQESANEINNNIDEMTDTIDQGLDNVIDNQDKNNQELQDTIDKGLQTCRDSLNLFNNKWTKGQAPSISNGQLINGNNFSMSTDTIYLDNTKSYTLKSDNSTNYQFYVFYYNNNEYLGYKNYNSTSTIYIRNSYFPGFTHVIFRIDGVQGDYPLFMLNEGNSALSYEPFGEKVCKSKLDEAEETRKGILQTIRELPQTLINLFLDMLKSLFIPSEEDLNEIIEESTSVTENFGFVGQSYSLVVDLFTSMVHVQQGNACTTLPELTLKFGGILNMQDYTLWQERNVCVSDNEWFGNETPQINIVRTILTIGLVANFISFAISQIHEILSKEDTKS